MKRHYTTIFIGMILYIALLVWAFASEPYQKFLKNKCEWCGRSNVRLVVHHLKPQHLFPELAQMESNCVTLCDPRIMRSTGCHFKIGHRGINWKYDNSEWCVILFSRMQTNETQKIQL